MVLRMFLAFALAFVMWTAAAPATLEFGPAAAIAQEAPEAAQNRPAPNAPAAGDAYRAPMDDDAADTTGTQAGDAPRDRDAWYVNPLVLAVGIAGIALVIALLTMGSRSTTHTTVTRDHH